jgi:hypothetical protein
MNTEYTYWHVDFTNHESAVVYAKDEADAKQAALDLMARNYREVVVAARAYRCAH